MIDVAMVNAARRVIEAAAEWNKADYNIAKLQQGASKVPVFQDSLHPILSQSRVERKRAQADASQLPPEQIGAMPIFIFYRK
jgi:hypothetical protein